MVRNSFGDLCVSSVRESVRFYRDLLGLEVLVDHGWYVELGHDGRVMLALVERGHPTVPADAGHLLSFEVDDAAGHLPPSIVPVWPLTRELGQLHFMVRDPDGTIVDVIERVDLTREDMRRFAAYRRAAC